MNFHNYTITKLISLNVCDMYTKLLFVYMFFYRRIIEIETKNIVYNNDYWWINF